jgi:hypothetical protein
MLPLKAGRGIDAPMGDARNAMGRGSDVEEMRRAATRALLVSIVRVSKVNQMSESSIKEKPSIYLHRMARFIVEVERPDWLKLEGSRAFDMTLREKQLLATTQLGDRRRPTAIGECDTVAREGLRSQVATCDLTAQAQTAVFSWRMRCGEITCGN